MLHQSVAYLSNLEYIVIDVVLTLSEETIAKDSIFCRKSKELGVLILATAQKVLTEATQKLAWKHF